MCVRYKGQTQAEQQPHSMQSEQKKDNFNREKEKHQYLSAKKKLSEVRKTAHEKQLE